MTLVAVGREAGEPADTEAGAEERKRGGDVGHGGGAVFDAVGRALR